MPKSSTNTKTKKTTKSSNENNHLISSSSSSSSNGGQMNGTSSISSTAMTTTTTTTSSVVDKINLLRSFVSNELFSETDLSQCLRQANYNIEVAAERLITGQFVPTTTTTKRRKMTDVHLPNSTSTMTSTNLHSSRAATPITTTTTTTTSTTKRKIIGSSPPPLMTSTSTASSTRTTTTIPMRTSTPVTPNLPRSSSEDEPIIIMTNPSKASFKTPTTTTSTPMVSIQQRSDPATVSSYWGMSSTSSLTSSSSSNKAVTTATRTTTRRGVVSPKSVDGTISSSSWLLCHRWISDGVCLQRNGCIDYQETLQVEVLSSSTSSSSSSSSLTSNRKGGSSSGNVGGGTNTNTSSPNNSYKIPSVRFRGKRILGQFPRHLHAILGPLLEVYDPHKNRLLPIKRKRNDVTAAHGGEDNNNDDDEDDDGNPLTTSRTDTTLKKSLIQIKAQALMEDRFLPIGVDVALAVWIYLPDPVAFFDLLHPQAVDSSLRSSKAFFSSSTGKKSAATKNVEGRTILQQAALGLLQWAQNGESFVFSSPSASLSSSHDDEKGDENDDSDENDDMMMVVDDRDEVMGEEGGNKDGANDDNDGLMSVQQTRLDEMDAPIEFKATLRPYQRQALWWMTQREAQEELEESSKQQLQLLEELVQANSPTMSNSPISSAGSAPPIHCECGPVQVDVTQISAPAFDDLDSNPEMKHPLWERRFLTNSTKTVARSFYVQPLFGCAMAIPPEPPRACRGGILADSMGLGKTVMLLALIQTSIKNEASRGAPTLIVSPLSLLLQWQEEIESKTNMTYRTYYGDNKQGDDINVDIVLTTYGSLQSEWLACAKASDTSAAASVGVLLHQEWKRVILDEAHYVKNTSTVASRACRMLRAERRWCVSGTIIQNSLDDVHSLLTFLRHEPWCHKSFWKSAISSKLRSTDSTPDDKRDAMDRVRRLLAPIMLRRTKASLDEEGKPILTLPPVDTKDIPVQFSPAEREFYDALHRKSLSLFEGFVQAGTASKSWLAIFSLLHRLRQTCDHVALTVKSHLDDEEWANQIAQGPVDSSERKDTRPVKDAIDKRFLDDIMGKFRAMQSTGKKGIVYEDVPYATKIAQMLNEAVKSKTSVLKEECSICLEPINIHESVVTPCFHIFCRDCLVGVLRKTKAPQDSASSKALAMLRLPNGPCPVCNEEIETSKILRLSESGGHIHTSYLLTSMVQPTLVANREGDGTARQTLETAVRGSSSSKLTAILQELEKVWEEEPGSKVLIFSQFLGFLDLVEESFKKDGIPYARLDGKLSLKDRVRVLNEFGSHIMDTGRRQKELPLGTKQHAGSVLLISMKAGGVGLNLVAANTVFIADRWWNAAVEDQCVDRIHRIGQMAEKVRVRMFYVANSVEERIVELQKRKKNVASEVLCDAGQANTNSQTGSLPTLEDFKILFQE